MKAESNSEPNENEPNEETLSAFRETEKGIDLIECESFDDFVKKLGLK